MSLYTYPERWHLGSSLERSTVASSIASTVALGYLVLAGLVAYRLLAHPLAGYPGPILARISGFYAVYHAYIGDIHLDMLRCHERYGPVVRYGPNKIIFNDISAIKGIYSKSANVQKSKAYRAFETSPTAHDLQSTVNRVEHARKKRIVAQAFSDSALRSLEHHIIPHIEMFVQKISAHASTYDNCCADENIQLSMSDWSNYVSFDLMTELVFGKALGMLRDTKHRYIIDLIQQAAFRVGVCLQMPLLSVLGIDGILAPSVKADRDRYIETSRGMALSRMQMSSGRKDVLSYILAAEDPVSGMTFSTDEIWGEATLLIIAGSDAISTALASTFFYLSRHPEAQAKAAHEVRNRFSSTNDIRMGQQLSSCHYLRACIDESIRMSPPVGAALWREVLAGGAEIAGNYIAPGLDVGVGIYAMQHNPKYYPEPFKFMPDRWIASEKTPSESVNLVRTAFQAFSTGPVACLGKGLAYLELSLILAHVLFELQFRSSSPAADDKSYDAHGYLKDYELHAKFEYRLRDRFTSWKSGPDLVFKKRECNEAVHHVK